MTDLDLEYGAPEMCRHCMTEIWLDSDAELYFNERPLVDPYDVSWKCPATGDEHEPIL